jgi:hypothetical protein
MNSRPLFASALALAAAASLPACDAQTDPTYGGEPLATMHGTVTSSDPSPPAQASVTLIWEVWTTNGDTASGVQVPVSGDFPASFTLDLLAPPPADVLNPPPPGETAQVGTAYIAVLPEGVEYDPEMDEEDFLGAAPEHVLVYVAEDIQPGSYWESYLRSLPTAGYHLYRWKKPTAAEEVEIDACQAQASDDCTECKAQTCEGCEEDCEQYCVPSHCDAEQRGLHPIAEGFGEDVHVHIVGPGESVEGPDDH